MCAFQDSDDTVRPPTPEQLKALSEQNDMTEELRNLYQVSQFIDNLSGPALRERVSFTPTCNMQALLSGYTGTGVKTVLPAHAMAKIDFRLVPNQDPHDILAKLQSHLLAGGYDDIHVSVYGTADPVVTPIETPFVQKIISIARILPTNLRPFHPLLVDHSISSSLTPLRRHPWPERSWQSCLLGQRRTCSQRTYSSR